MTPVWQMSVGHAAVDSVVSFGVPTTEELRHETLKDHRRILEAIAAHDPAGARKAMRAHLERVTRTFSRG